ncbi:DUF427 domain-containing protein [Nocardioides sp. GXQ0305]|uniref:DUF427 domain-containing protein n=1 Tax=Nocardioides sp. GXQ0305 TaxID=3423912 RepID=UPI003D7D9164
MAVDLSREMLRLLPELRTQPVPKQLTVRLGSELVAVTHRPVLVMEPMRVVPSYAVPVADLRVGLEATEAGPPPEYREIGFGDGPPLLDPSVPFAVHSTDGETVDLHADGRTGAGFRPRDLPDLVVLDFDDFDWWEEDEPLVGHPRDPFHRIDVRRSSRRVRISHEGTLLAESGRPWALFEATFPLVRWYLPREDVVADLLPGEQRTTCAYKGHATHFSVDVGASLLRDIAWCYEQPLDDARDVIGCVAFYQERLDVEVDGVPVGRVRTPWS